jgi:hypothetical protein
MTATAFYFDEMIFDDMSHSELLKNIEDLVFTNSYAETGSDQAKIYQTELEEHLKQMARRGFETVGDLISACL